MRTSLLLTTATALAVAVSFACDPGTRIRGEVTLGDGMAAPDSARHTLYIAAFGSGAVMNGILNTGATPVWIEFGGIANGDFDPSVSYALGGAGGSEELSVYAWWKVARAEQPDYVPVEPGDRFGRFEGNPIFEGRTGGGTGGSAVDVDIVLIRTFVSGSSGF